jgi:CDP-4-dehydro-6-deoxyglucose reductase/ferredoxin-NAD(P)+ reductase (naphthalene dioxygenase ferredoxin-specific)
MTEYQVTFANICRSVACGPEQTLLSAAVLAGIDYPYGCASGNCGACVCKLESGDVSLLPRGDAALSQEQAATGQTLACRARPLSDVTVTWLGRGRR